MGDELIDCNITMNCTMEEVVPNYTAFQSEIVSWLSIVAAVLSATYVISYIVFHKEMKKKTSNEIIFYIQLSNVLTSAGSG